MGIDLISSIQPKNSGAFPTHEAIYGKGGWQTRTNSTDRDSIPTLNRTEGMQVYVVSEGQTYRLGPGLTNSDWIVVVGAGGVLANATSGTQNDVVTTSPTTPISEIRFSAVTTVTGLASGWAGRELVLLATGGAVTINDQNAGSVAANRFITGTGASLIIPDGTGLLVVYDATTQRWRMVGGSGSSSVSGDIARSGGPGTDINRAIGLNGHFLNTTSVAVPPDGGSWTYSVSSGKFEPTWPKRPGEHDLFDTPGIHPYATIGAARAGLDSSAGLQVALDAMGDLSNVSKGGELLIPQGFYRLAADVHVRRTGHLRGVGTGGRFAVTVMVMDEGVSFYFDSYADSADGGRTDFLRTESIEWTGPLTPVAAAGVVCRSQCHFRFCSFISLGGTGLTVDGSISSGYNANLGSMEMCWFENNLLNGFFIHGGNGNSWDIRQCLFSSNGLWGVYDSSFLGNHYTGCLAEGNGIKAMNIGGPYYSEGSANRACFLVCYAELDQGPCNLEFPASVFGGNLEGVGFAAPLDSGSKALRIIHGNYASPMAIVNDLGVVEIENHVSRNNTDQVVQEWAAFYRTYINILSSTNTTPIGITTVIPHQLANGSTVTITDHLVNTNANGTWTIAVTGASTYNLVGSVGNGVGGQSGKTRAVEDPDAIRTKYDQSAVGQERWITGSGSLAPAYEITAKNHFDGKGKFRLPAGAYFGNGSNSHIINGGYTAAPSSGSDFSPRDNHQWFEGDLILNRNATGASPFGWICTVDGLPGVWKNLGCPGERAIPMDNASYSMVAIEYANQILKVTSSTPFTADHNLTFPTCTDAFSTIWFVKNTQSGDFNVICTTGAGTTVSVAKGESAWVGIDSTGVYRVGRVQSASVDRTDQTTTKWKDSPNTGTASAKTAAYSRRRHTQTTTATASQVLDDGGTYAGEDFTLANNAITRVKATLMVKKSGVAAGGTIDLQGDFYRDAGGNAVLVGTVSVVYNLVGATLDGTTATLAVNTTKVEVQVSPESADTLDWGIYRTDLVGGAAATL